MPGRGRVRRSKQQPNRPAENGATRGTFSGTIRAARPGDHDDALGTDQSPQRIRGWLRWRLAAWRDDNGTSIASRTQRITHGLWAYRIGDYRMICDIQDEKLVIVALDFDHRSQIYG